MTKKVMIYRVIGCIFAILCALTLFARLKIHLSEGPSPSKNLMYTISGLAIISILFYSAYLSFAHAALLKKYKSLNSLKQTMEDFQ